MDKSAVVSELITLYNQSLKTGDTSTQEYYSELICLATPMAIMEAPIIKRKKVELYFECPSCKSEFQSEETGITTCPVCSQQMTWSMHFIKRD